MLLLRLLLLQQAWLLVWLLLLLLLLWLASLLLLLLLLLLWLASLLLAPLMLALALQHQRKFALGRDCRWGCELLLGRRLPPAPHWRWGREGGGAAQNRACSRQARRRQGGWGRG